MLSRRIIACLDIAAGRVVKGVEFTDLRDAGDPVELAARYDAEGADELVFLDITASSDQRETIVDVVRRTAEQVFISAVVLPVPPELESRPDVSLSQKQLDILLLFPPANPLFSSLRMT